MEFVGTAAGDGLRSLVSDQIHAAEEELFRRLLAPPKRYVSILLDLDDEVELLRRILPCLKEVILNAEVKRETKELHDALRSFYEDAVDILDEHDTVLKRAAQRQQRPVADLQRSRFFRSLLNLVCGCLPCFDCFDYESVPLRLYQNAAKEIVGLYDAWNGKIIEMVSLHPVAKDFKDRLRCVRERTTKARFDREIAGGLLRRGTGELLEREKKLIHEEIAFMREKILPELEKVILNADMMEEIARDFKSIAVDTRKILEEFSRETAESQSNAAAATGHQQPSGFRDFLSLVCGCLPLSRLGSPEHEPVPLTLYVEIANQIKGVYDRLEELRSGVDKLDLSLACVKDVAGLLRDRTSDEVLRARFRSAVQEGVTKKVAYREMELLRKISLKIKNVKRTAETRWRERGDEFAQRFVSDVESVLEAFTRSNQRSLLNLVFGCLPCFDCFDYDTVPLPLCTDVAERIFRFYKDLGTLGNEVDRLQPEFKHYKNLKDGLRLITEGITTVGYRREDVGGSLTRETRLSLGRVKKVIHSEITFLREKFLPELQKAILNADTDIMPRVWGRIFGGDVKSILDEFDRKMVESRLNAVADRPPGRFRVFLHLVFGCLPLPHFDFEDSPEYGSAPLTFYVGIADRIKIFYRFFEWRVSSRWAPLFVGFQDAVDLLRDRASNEESVEGFQWVVREEVTKKVVYEEINFLRKKFLPKLIKFKRDAQTVLGESPDALAAKLGNFVWDAENILETFDVLAGWHWEELPCSSYLGSLRIRIKTAKQIQELNVGLENLRSLEERARQFITDATNAVKEQSPEADGPPRRPVGDALLCNNFLFVGREEVKKRIVEELLPSEPPSKPSMVLVTGMGGIGKTTLVYDIFHRQLDLVKDFVFRKWVTVGNELDPVTIMGRILNKEKASQQDVRSELEGKRFLIVLDDCWSGKLRGWKELWIPLEYGSNGSKVIVTSRGDIRGELIPANVKQYQLGVLSDEECLRIFESCAFPGGVPSTSVKSSSINKLRKIGVEIVKKKIRGLPLSASVLGSSLSYNEDEKAWENVLRRVSDGDNNIISVLLWSYRRLPSHLKQCFAYLSMFPKNSYLKKGEVIYMWMAHGYIQPRYDMTLEYIGHICFDDLVRASLIQKWQVGSNVYYKMHDLVHDLATSVSISHGCFPDITAALDNCKHARHLLIEDNGSYETYSGNSTKLQSLLNFHEPAFISRFQLQYVRVLAVSRKQHLGRINFDKAIHLRYLDLTQVKCNTFPESICNIYNLQTLLFGESMDQNFPLGAWNLPNLCRLEGGTSIKMIGISNSKSLQIINNFNLSSEGEDIKELGALNEVQELKINYLSRVQSPQSALKAQLRNKKYIYKLVLDWEDSFLGKEREEIGTRNEIKQNDILNNLCPHERLRILEIRNYTGDKFPSWIRTKHLLKLVELNLHYLYYAVELPPLGHLPQLEKLDILELRNVKCIGDEFYGTEADVFPSLKVLRLNNMHKLEKWMESICHIDRVRTCFPSLERLEVWGCQNLSSLPRRLPKLKQMDLVALLKIGSICSNDNSVCCDVPCLEELKISLCSSRSLNECLQRYGTSSLRKLELYRMDDCTNLVFNYSRKCLESLRIYHMHALTSIKLVNLDPLKEYREAAYPKLCITIAVDMLCDVAIVNSEDGKITDEPLELRVSRCSQEALSKFALDQDYIINNEVDIITYPSSTFLRVIPRTVR